MVKRFLYNALDPIYWVAFFLGVMIAAANAR